MYSLRRRRLLLEEAAERGRVPVLRGHFSGSLAGGVARRRRGAAGQKLGHDVGVAEARRVVESRVAGRVRRVDGGAEVVDEPRNDVRVAPEPV